jgi:hypothetical protein
MGLQSFSNGKESQWKSLWKPAAVSLGLIIVLFVSKVYLTFPVQMMVILHKSYGPGFVDALKSR